VAEDTKRKKCLCCKQLGHDMKECPRDPNIKTREDANKDMIRISQLKTIESFLLIRW